MKREQLRIKVLVMLVLFALISSNAGVLNLDAKKSIKLSCKKCTIKAGSEKVIKLLNAEKKVSWSTSNKKDISIKPFGKKQTSCKVEVKKTTKVKNAKVYAKVGKKKYTCKITVSQKQSEKDKIADNTPSNEEPAVQPVDIETLKSNYQRLYDYIHSGAVEKLEDEDGVFYKMTEVYGANQYYIYYNEPYEFSFVAATTEEVTHYRTLFKISVERDKVDKCNWITYNKYSNDSGKQWGEYRADLKGIETKNYGPKMKFDLETKMYTFTDKTLVQYQQEAELFCQNAFAGWDELLKPTGLTMKDLGFTK